MGGPVRITTAVPSIEETARLLGVPLARAKELEELAEAIHSAPKRSSSRRATTGRKGANRHGQSRPKL